MSLREKIKSFAIVLLIVMLFFNLFLYISFRMPVENKTQRMELSENELTSFIAPLYISYTDSKFGIAKSSLNEKFKLGASQVLLLACEKFAASSPSLVNEPAYADSITFYMDLNLDFKSLLGIYIKPQDAKNMGNWDIEGRLRELILPLGSNNMVFRIGDKYYEVPYDLEIRLALEDMKNSVIASSSVRYEYKYIEKAGGDIVVPVSGYLAPPVYIKKTAPAMSDSELEGLTRAIFGAGSDFLKGALTGDGSLILVYGYGDEVLNIDRTGLVHYRNNQSLNPGSCTMREAYEAACSLLVRLTKFKQGYVLREALYDEELDLYTFNFSLSILDLPVIVEADEYDVIIEVKSGMVSSFTQNNYEIELSPSYNNNRGVEFSRSYITKLLNTKNVSDMIEKLGEIEGIELAYLNSSSGLNPVIVIKIPKENLYIDYYNGVLR